MNAPTRWIEGLGVSFLGGTPFWLVLKGNQRKKALLIVCFFFGWVCPKKTPILRVRCLAQAQFAVLSDYSDRRPQQTRDRMFQALRTHLAGLHGVGLEETLESLGLWVLRVVNISPLSVRKAVAPFADPRRHYLTGHCRQAEKQVSAC